jgi:hypothetical protein
MSGGLAIREVLSPCARSLSLSVASPPIRCLSATYTPCHLMANNELCPHSRSRVDTTLSVMGRWGLE